jgi:hypothetical protein
LITEVVPPDVGELDRRKTSAGKRRLVRPGAVQAGAERESAGCSVSGAVEVGGDGGRLNTS